MSDHHCDRCAQLEQVIADLQASEARLTEDRDLGDREIRRLRREANALRQELRQHYEDDPKAQEIRGLLEHYRQQLDHPRMLLPLDGAGATAVRRALRWKFSAADIRQAIDGCALMPYVGEGGRTSDPDAPGARKHDDLSLILRSEEHIRRFMGYAQAQPERGKEPDPMAAVERVLSALEGVRKGDDGNWTALCPAHEDREQSLSVRQGRKGALVKCFAGCEFEQIAAALGLELTDLFDRDDEEPVRPKQRARRQDPLPTRAAVSGWQRALAEHPALLERLHARKGWTPGVLARLGVGWDAHQKRIVFPVHGPDGCLVTLALYRPAGKPKMIGLRGRVRGLFPAPESLPPEVPLWLVEGEPDAVTGHHLGLAAVAVPGVNGWRPEWANRFRGRSVLVCMDCDKPGRIAAGRIAASLAGVAGQVRVVDLDPGRDDGWDLSDFLLAGGNRQALGRLVAVAGVVHGWPDRQAAA